MPIQGASGECMALYFTQTENAYCYTKSTIDYVIKCICQMNTEGCDEFGTMKYLPGLDYINRHGACNYPNIFISSMPAGEHIHQWTQVTVCRLFE